MGQQFRARYRRPQMILTIATTLLIVLLGHFSPILHFGHFSIGKGEIAAAQSNPDIQVSFNNYPISGSTAQELRAEMNRRGPVDPQTGQRFSGYTQWFVRWNYRYREQAGQCWITTAQVRTTVTITMPQWQPPIKASRHLVERWNRFFNALKLHEEGHRDHGIAASQEILELLQDFPGQPSCATLETKANVSARQVIQKYNQKDLEYDRVTRHGATQGAVFP